MPKQGSPDSQPDANRMSPEKYDDFVEQNRNRIYSYLYHQLHNDAQAAEDLTQQVFTNIYKFLLTNPPPRDLLAYISTASKHALGNYYNRNKFINSKEELLEDSHDMIPDPDLPNPEQSILAKAEHLERKIFIKEMEALLTDNQKPVFRLLYRGYKPIEIAKILNTTHKAIGSYLHAIRIKLKKSFPDANGIFDI